MLKKFNERFFESKLVVLDDNNLTKIVGIFCKVKDDYLTFMTLRGVDKSFGVVLMNDQVKIYFDYYLNLLTK